jgi:opacity protein-like surface antigen
MIPRTSLARFAITIVFLCWIAAASAEGQSWEVTGLAGYTPSADLNREAPELDEVAIRGGATWGVQAGRLLTPRWGVEALWTHQQSALEIDADGQNADLFKLDVDQLQGNVIFHFGAAGSRLQPFALAGAGVTFFSADDVQSETKLSFGFGAGLKFFPWRAVGIRGHFRYKPHALSDEEAAPFCDPFGFCQNWLRQVEVMAGAVVRF